MISEGDKKIENTYLLIDQQAWLKRMNCEMFATENFWYQETKILHISKK